MRRRAAPRRRKPRLRLKARGAVGEVNGVLGAVARHLDGHKAPVDLFDVDRLSVHLGRQPSSKGTLKNTRLSLSSVILAVNSLFPVSKDEQLTAARALQSLDIFVIGQAVLNSSMSAVSEMSDKKCRCIFDLLVVRSMAFIMALERCSFSTWSQKASDMKLS